MTSPSFTVPLVAATDAEISPLRDRLDGHTRDFGHDEGVVFRYLTTGVGPVTTAALLTEELLTHPVDLIINLGLGGSIDRDIPLGTVLLVDSETFGDLGAEDLDGRHLSVFDLGLDDADTGPYDGGVLKPLPLPRTSDAPASVALAELIEARFPAERRVSASTVSQSHGSAGRIALFEAGSDATVVSMEGAAVFFVAFRQNTPSLQFRSISNYVEPRNRAAWDIPLAMERLTEEVFALLVELRRRVRDAPVSPPPPSL